MKAESVKITDNVYWVGALHWNTRSFHWFAIPGTTYNSYLVFGEEKVALIDNVFSDGMIDQLNARIEDAFAKENREVNIDVFIQCHTELDHSIGLKETINRFKVDHAELIDDAFKTTVLMAKELDLIKLKHIAIDGTKIKAKASINNLTNQEQVDLLKDILQKSIELDEEEDELLGDESGNSVPKELIDKESFEKIYKKVIETTKGDRNEFKLRRSSKKLLEQAQKDKKSAKKILKKVEKIDTELQKTTNDVISINDPESRWMLNKKSKYIKKIIYKIF